MAKKNALEEIFGSPQMSTMPEEQETPMWLSQAAPEKIEIDPVEAVAAEDDGESAPASWQNMLGKALVGAVPLALGAALGGSRGAGAGATEGAKQIDKLSEKEQKDFKAKKDRDLKKQQIAATTALKNAEMATKKSQHEETIAAMTGKQQGDDKYRYKALEQAREIAEQQIAAQRAANAQKKEDMLPLDAKKSVETLATKNANLAAISNELSAALTQFDDPNLTVDQKLTGGYNLLKTLNSTQGQDAVGAEEVKRLSSFLENKMFNFFQPGSKFGRDLPEFRDQVASTINRLGKTHATNNAMIEQYKNKGIVELPQVELTGKSSRNEALAAAGTGWMKPPAPPAPTVDKSKMSVAELEAYKQQLLKGLPNAK